MLFYTAYFLCFKPRIKESTVTVRKSFHFMPILPLDSCVFIAFNPSFFAETANEVVVGGMFLAEAQACRQLDSHSPWVTVGFNNYKNFKEFI